MVAGLHLRRHASRRPPAKHQRKDWPLHATRCKCILLSCYGFRLPARRACRGRVCSAAASSQSASCGVVWRGVAWCRAFFSFPWRRKHRFHVPAREEEAFLIFDDAPYLQKVSSGVIWNSFLCVCRDVGGDLAKIWLPLFGYGCHFFKKKKEVCLLFGRPNRKILLGDHTLVSRNDNGKFHVVE